MEECRDERWKWRCWGGEGLERKEVCCISSSYITYITQLLITAHNALHVTRRIAGMLQARRKGVLNEEVANEMILCDRGVS